MAASSPSVGAGTLLGERYRVGAVIARGGMGAVYEGVDERLGRAIAVKVLRSELAREDEAAKRFEREALTVARLGHPNVAQVLDFGRSAEGAYLVMERVPGTTLSKLLERDARVAPLRAAELCRQVLDALASAHAAGVVHRDIKPGNVMVFSSGASGGEIVKLLDFGIARMMETQAYTRLTGTGAIVGTPAYMAPEQARGEGVDARTDVYAVGVLLYCLLSGRRPFRGDVVAMLEGVLYGEAPSLGALVPDAPPSLIGIAERAMRKDPGRRFQSAAEMAQALGELLAASSEPHEGERASRVGRTSLLTPEALSPTRVSHEPPASASQVAWRASEVPPTPAPAPPSMRDAVVRRPSLLGLGAGLAVAGLVTGLGLASALAAGMWWWARASATSEASVAEASPAASPHSGPSHVAAGGATVTNVPRVVAPPPSVGEALTLRLDHATDALERSVVLQTGEWGSGPAGSQCPGRFGATPQIRLELSEGLRMLSILASAGVDSMLAVRRPDGGFECDDDDGGYPNPRVDLGAPAAGTYEIYVGVFGTGAGALATVSMQSAQVAVSPLCARGRRCCERWAGSRRSRSRICQHFDTYSDAACEAQIQSFEAELGSGSCP
ncbi:MAG: protein kinase [Sandaracinus sp.]